MTTDRNTDYALLRRQLAALLSGEHDVLANTANINWAGIYVLRDGELVLGPFQGLPACVRIPVGQGVCGTAARDRETQRVDDVHRFEGHIVCDPASKSELVVPLAAGNRLVGVLDIDSPLRARFSVGDQQGIESLCADFAAHISASDSFI